MIFKNIIPFKITEKITRFDEIAVFDSFLEKHQFHPCSAHSESSMGWTQPAYTEQFTYQGSGLILICLAKEEKIMPAAAINKLVADKVAKIEIEEDRQVRRKERITIKEEIIFEKLPTALSKITKTYGYIDPVKNLVIIGAASTNKAEDFLSFLRKTLGSLPVVPIDTAIPPSITITNWVDNQNFGENSDIDCSLSFGDECSLTDGDRLIRCQNVDLLGDDVTIHIDSGMLLNAIGLGYKEFMAFVLTDDLSLKKIKNEAEYEGSIENNDELFDADFIIETSAINEVLGVLFKLLGIK